MDKISHDVYKSINVVNSNMLYVESKYNTLFFSTNENLDKLFSKIDVNGKNVLSVLGSGDHAFHLYNNGSSSVDVFDVNKLTIYYYYLRIWSIIYLKKYYLSLDNLSSEVMQVLSAVNINSPIEQDVYNFWINILKSVDNSFLYKLFHDVYDGDLSKNNITDLDKLVGILKEKDDFSFYNIDISKKVKINKKYDVIVTSNISDWIVALEGELKVYKDNLLRLLNDDGIILSSNVDWPIIKMPERRVFETDFEIIEYESEIVCGCREYPAGYIYKRKIK